MVFSALDPLADPAVYQIPRRSGDGQGVNHRNQDKRQLDVDGVQESRQQPCAGRCRNTPKARCWNSCGS